MTDDFSRSATLQDNNIPSSRRFDRIILHVPHSSVLFPFGKDAWDEGIDVQIAKWTDWYTDWLFASREILCGEVIPVVFPFSRFFCDVERLEDDPLNAVGQGIVYRKYDRLCRHLGPKEEEVITSFYHKHMQRLANMIRCDKTLLIDCHSFPSALSDVDICIGLNEDWSRPDESVIEHAKRHFENNGYEVGINTPYSNSITPKSEYPYKSMMIEVNKRVYLDESRLALSPDAALLQSSIGTLYKQLLNFQC